MKPIVPDLTDRLALLHVRAEVVFHINGPAHGIPAHPQDTSRYAALARILEGGLRVGDEDVVRIARGVVDPGDLSGSAPFWGTPLGRLLFEAGGFFGETLTQTTAAGLLGCSRQWVHAMVAEGKLAMAPEKGVYADEVRAVLKARAQRCEVLKARAEELGLDGDVK